MEWFGSGNYICQCLKISEDDMRQAITDRKLTTFEAVTEHFQTSWACGDCFDDIQAVIDECEDTGK